MMSAEPVQPVRAPTPRQSADTASLWDGFVHTRAQALREQLVHAYMGFARIMAAKVYAKRIYSDMEFSDYLQYATLGLIESIDRFEPDQGNKFETFAAPRITGAIMTGLETSSEIQQQISARRRVLAQRVESLTAIDDASNREEGPKAVFARLAEVAVGLAVGFALEHSGMHREEGAEYADNSYHGVELKQLRARVQALVAGLPDTQRQVVQGHYLQQLAFEQIAARLGLSRGRVAQLHKQALGTLRAQLGERGSIDLTC